MPVPLELLSRFAFFQPLAPADLRRLARVMTRRVAPANTLLFSESDPGDIMYLLVSGAVEIFSRGDTPEHSSFENRLNLLHAGDWFGELALIDDQPRSGSARTLGPSVLLLLPKREFRWLITTYPLALYTLAAMTQQRLRTRDRAYEAEMQMRLQQLEQLRQTALDITRHLERAQALVAIRDRAIELLSSAGGEIYLFDPKSHLLVPEATDGLEARPLKLGEGCTGIAFQTGRAVRQKRRSVRYELAAPIKLTDDHAAERCLGVLTVYRAFDGAPYQSTDETLLELFASQAAIVIENTELHKTRLAKERLDTELDDARRVQRMLIPAQPPSIRGYQVAALWYPAKQVSGDYYDFIPLSGGRVGFVIADVSGKGLDAALFMANTRSTLRASLNLGGSPADMLRYANRTLAADSQGGMFVTVFFGILDPQAHTFSYVNAGHNLPWLARAASRSLETLSGGNLALGIVRDVNYAASEITFARGDLLMLYTDGVTEATASDETLFGDERLIKTLRDSADQSARQVIQTLARRVRRFTGAEPQSDDITVVALRRV